MIERKFVPETEEFGVRPWVLLSRGVVDDQRTTVRGMGIRGRGVQVQTSRQQRDGEGWSNPAFDTPVLVDKVLILEYMLVENSLLSDAAGNPTSINVTVTGRELMSTQLATEKFNPPTPKGHRKKPGPNNNVQIIPGIVLTMEQRPQQGEA